MNMALQLEIPQKELQRLCQRYHVRRLSIFGSALREDFGSGSDLDVLVEFEPGGTPGFAFARLQGEFTELLGVQVDLHTYRSLSRYFREAVVEESQTIYERLPQRS